MGPRKHPDGSHAVSRAGETQAAHAAVGAPPDEPERLDLSGGGKRAL